MKTLLKVAVVSAVLLIGSNAFAAKQNSREIQACAQAAHMIEEMAGTRGYKYVDTTGREISIDYAALCTAIGGYNDYIEQKYPDTEENAPIKVKLHAVADLLLLRSNDSDKELEKAANDYITPEYISDCKLGGRPECSPSILKAQFKYRYLSSILKKSRRPRVLDLDDITPWMVKCYTGMVCSTDPVYGIGNKNFQNLLQALTQRDYEKAEKVSRSAYPLLFKEDGLSPFLEDKQVIEKVSGNEEFLILLEWAYAVNIAYF